MFLSFFPQAPLTGDLGGPEGGYHHHIALNKWGSLGGSIPAPGTTGLYHTRSYIRRERRLPMRFGEWLAAGIELEGAADPRG